MTNDKGSAIAIVLMVLAVISLIGVALLTQSQLDIQLSSSLTNYDRLFGLADGGATLGFETVKNREDLAETTSEGQPPHEIYPIIKDVMASTATQTYKSVTAGCNEASTDICYEEHTHQDESGVVRPSGVGGYATIIQALSDGQCCPGYECSAGGGYKFESWLSDGRGVREHTLGGTSSKVEVSVRICRKKGQ